MSECEGRRFSWQINWRITVFSLLFLPLLISLGLWQLDRAEEKQDLVKHLKQQQNLPGIGFSVITEQAISHFHHRSVEISGKYLAERYWLLEGKIVKGRPGYHLLMPFKTDSNTVVLTNRGWVAADPDRNKLPNITTPQGKQKITTRLRPTSDAILTDERDNPLHVWPHRVLGVDFDVMQEQLELEIFPAVFTLEPDVRGALLISSYTFNMKAEKHRGYAIQWFTMAFALSVLWLVANSNIVRYFSIK